MKVKRILSREDADKKLKSEFATTSETTRIITRTCSVSDGDTFLFRIVKKGVAADVVTCLVHNLGSCANTPTDTRGAAAGRLPSAKLLSGFVKRINKFSYRNKRGAAVAALVHSGIVGQTRAGSPSYWTRTHPKRMQAATPCIQAVNSAFQKAAPALYLRQARLLKGMPLTRLCDTVFTTIVVNRSLRTGFHRDNDMPGTFGVMVVGGDDTFNGALLLYPEYDIAVDVRVGDVLIFNGDVMHGNTSLKATKASPRYSFVFYVKKPASHPRP
jgi:hypothetical protein